MKLIIPLFSLILFVVLGSILFTTITENNKANLSSQSSASNTVNKDKTISDLKDVSKATPTPIITLLPQTHPLLASDSEVVNLFDIINKNGIWDSVGSINIETSHQCGNIGEFEPNIIRYGACFKRRDNSKVPNYTNMLNYLQNVQGWTNHPNLNPGSGHPTIGSLTKENYTIRYVYDTTGGAGTIVYFDISLTEAPKQLTNIYEDDYVKLKYPDGFKSQALKNDNGANLGGKFDNGTYSLSFVYSSFVTTGAGFGYFGDSDAHVQECKSTYEGDVSSPIYNPAVPKYSTYNNFKAVSKYIDTSKCNPNSAFGNFSGIPGNRYGGSFAIIDLSTFPGVNIKPNDNDKRMSVRFQYDDFYVKEKPNYNGINTLPQKGDADLLNNLNLMDSISYSISFKSTPPQMGVY